MLVFGVMKSKLVISLCVILGLINMPIVSYQVRLVAYSTMILPSVTASGQEYTKLW